jgi:hypothetical protein
MMNKCLVLALMLSSGIAVAQTPAVADAEPQGSAASRLASSGSQIDREQLSARLESVSKLLDQSSAARQIDASGDARALTQREKAREIYKTARTAYTAGDLAKASQLLTLSTVLMFEAVRFAAPEAVTGKKLEVDFDARHESVKALLGAYKRIAAEKSGVKGVNETVASIEKSVAEALKLATAGKYQEGRAELDRAYLVAKAGVSTMRSGDTLVRSLNFASKQEEYHYEIDRNDTHQMLIKVLVDEKRAANPQLDQQIVGFLAKAKELRSAAESSAARKAFDEAVKQLEESTVELVRAIRNAGIYIPG